MEYRQLGKSNLKISAIAFGAWAAGGWMWGGTDQKEAVNAIETSIDLGVTTIDTAPAYGMGFSEEIVGEVARMYRKDVQLLTKFGLRWDTTEGEFFFDTKNNQGKDVKMHKFSGAQSIIKECEDSLKRLRTDYIDLFQIHWPDKTTKIEESFEAVEQLIKQGKVLHAGVCNYSPDQIKAADKVTSIISNQVPYSMVNRGIEKEIVPFCIESGKGILAYSPLQRGLLSGKITENYQFAEGDHRAGLPHFKPDFVKKTNAFLAKIKPLADEKKATLSQLVIKWTILQPGITCALVGARNTKQAEENAKAIEVKLSQEEIKFINQELEKIS